MDKKTPSKSNKADKDVTSPELPLTLPPQLPPPTRSHDPREIQETPARPKIGASSTAGAVQDRSQGRLPQKDFPDNEHATEDDPSLHRSFGKKMRGSSPDETAGGAGETSSETEKMDKNPESDFYGKDGKDWAYLEEELDKVISEEEGVEKGREKTPEDKELPEVVPETPQPERKKQKMDYE